MCGRFVREAPTEEIAKGYGADSSGVGVSASYNVAPSTEVVIVVEEGGRRRLKSATWGFVPHWARPGAKVRSVINARAETIAEKPFFRDAFKGSRCIVVATGFYEWRVEGKKKTPVYIRMRGRRFMNLAGLYSVVEGEDGVRALTAAVITVEANSALAGVHDRMPAILDDEAAGVWLSPASTAAELKDVLAPCPDDAVEFFDVSRAVNNPGNDTPENIVPA